MCKSTRTLREWNLAHAHTQLERWNDFPSSLQRAILDSRGLNNKLPKPYLIGVRANDSFTACNLYKSDSRTLCFHLVWCVKPPLGDTGNRRVYTGPYRRATHNPNKRDGYCGDSHIPGQHNQCCTPFGNHQEGKHNMVIRCPSGLSPLQIASSPILLRLYHSMNQTLDTETLNIQSNINMQYILNMKVASSVPFAVVKSEIRSNQGITTRLEIDIEKQLPHFKTITKKLGSTLLDPVESLHNVHAAMSTTIPPQPKTLKSLKRSLESLQSAMSAYITELDTLLPLVESRSESEIFVRGIKLYFSDLPFDRNHRIDRTFDSANQPSSKKQKKNIINID